MLVFYISYKSLYSRVQKFLNVPSVKKCMRNNDLMVNHNNNDDDDEYVG